MAQKKNINLGSKASKAKGGKSSASAPVTTKKSAAKAVAAKPGKVQTAKAPVKPIKSSAAKVQAKSAAVRKPASNAALKAKVAQKSKPQVKPEAKSHSKPLAKPQAKAVSAKAAASAPKAQVKPAGVPPVRQAPAAAPRAMTAAVDKGQGPKITAPAPQPAAAAPKVVPKAAPAPAAEKKADKPAGGVRHGFKVNEYVVYPTQGVGKVIGIEEEEIAGMKLELFKIEFEKERLILRVPMGKVQSVGMRKLADDSTVKRALDTLKGRARIKRTMWSRRAQEYEAKINSGDLFAVAEVVRDLYRSEAQPEQSYSERQLYEQALERMAREVAAVERLDERGAVQRITEILAKSAKGRAASTDSAGNDGDAKAA